MIQLPADVQVSVAFILQQDSLEAICGEDARTAGI
jgi:hypothetical protein